VKILRIIPRDLLLVPVRLRRREGDGLECRDLDITVHSISCTRFLRMPRSPVVADVDVLFAALSTW
jgi:hypothetical protein